MSIAIKVENLSKAYQLGEIGTGTISRDLERWVARVRGKEDPFLKIGEANDRTVKSTSGVVWSLKDVSFKIGQGDAVGIIGRNGAGKSTLLKILSRVTSPTTGKISGRGRIASLLEVGTGFHPELTGRENIFLNGAILGMRKKEIARKFDEILDFAGVERYVDTPVKRYSSGMYVRLAFAVAAHLESEILIVDEVLAVGDAEFQKKCLGKMGEVSKGEGRTVLFVSHNMGAVMQLCQKGILLKQGEVFAEGPVEKVVNNYAKDIKSKTLISQTVFDGPLANTIALQHIVINEGNVDLMNITVLPAESIRIQLLFKALAKYELRVGLSIFKDGVRLFTLHDVPEPEKLLKEEFASDFLIPAYLLRPGIYSISIGAYESSNSGDWVWGTEICSFEVLEEWSDIYEMRSFGIINVTGKNQRIYK